MERSLPSALQKQTESALDPFLVRWISAIAAAVAVLTAAIGAATGAHDPTELRGAFEVISVRPSVPLGPPPPGLDPARAAKFLMPCSGQQMQVDARRFAVSRIPLHGLIALAYGRSCQPPDLLFGGPAWVRADGYDVEATLPAGSPGYTRQQLNNGAAPQLQTMLKTMLAERFKLVLRPEMREMPVYNLIVVSEGKLTSSVDDPDPGTRARDPMLVMLGTTMSKLAGTLQAYMDRPVIDRTDLAGLFDIRLTFPGLSSVPPSERDGEQRRQVPARLQEQLGLTLRPATAAVEVLVIESVDRPRAN